MNPSAMVDQLNSILADVTNQFQSLAQSLQNVGSSLQRLATAGIAATTEGNKLAYTWTLFTRQIASIFLPVLDIVIGAMLRLTEWMRGLSGEGQSLAMNIGLASVAAKVLIPALTMLRSIFSPIALAVGLLFEGLMQFFTGTAEGAALLSALSEIMAIFTPIIGAFGTVFKVVVDALVSAFQFMYRAFVQIAIWIGGLVETILDWIPGMGDATEAVKKWRENAEANLLAMENKGFGADSKVNKDKQRRDVTPAGFAFESLSASFERITAEANKKDLAKEALDTNKAQLEEQKKTNELIAKNGWGTTSGGGGDF